MLIAGYLPVRYLIAVMMYIGLMLNYILRINLNLTILTMVKSYNSTDNSSASQASDNVCGFEPDQKTQDDYVSFYVP